MMGQFSHDLATSSPLTDHGLASTLLLWDSQSLIKNCLLLLYLQFTLLEGINFLFKAAFYFIFFSTVTSRGVSFLVVLLASEFFMIRSCSWALEGNTMGHLVIGN